jgi:hypothetical protein
VLPVESLFISETEKFLGVQVGQLQTFQAFKQQPAISNQTQVDLSITPPGWFQLPAVLPTRNQHLRWFRLVGGLVIVEMTEN